AVRGRSAIRIDNDLAPRQSGVAVRPADVERAGRIDMPGGVLRDPALGQRLAHIRLDDGTHRAGRQILHAMLVRDDDLPDADRLAVLVAHGDLALGVGAELGSIALLALARGGEVLQDLVAVVDRRRHQHGRLAAGVAEHDALVARTFLLVGRLL